MPTLNAADEDWKLLLSFLPRDWKQLAQTTCAMKGLRQDKSEENCLRVLLMHLGCGLSMRETVVRAQEANLADLSDVALLKRLRKSQEWLYELCRALFEERGLQPKVPSSHSLRLIDATEVKEPGKTGSLWRIHYSLRWPTLKCDFFKLTANEGQGTGESLQHFPLEAEDYVLADRGYCHASGIHHAARHKAFLTVRLNPDGIRLQTGNGGDFPLLQRLKSVQQTGQIAVWTVRVPEAYPPPVAGGFGVIPTPPPPPPRPQPRLRRKASKRGSELQPQTLIYAEYVMVLTTFPQQEFPAAVILQWYRFRWQIELVFKRFKQIAQLGHLPKQDPASAKAWLYGKLFVALLTDKLIQQARAFSPWGYEWPPAIEAA
jgi:hypothetical protein